MCTLGKKLYYVGDLGCAGNCVLCEAEVAV